MANRKPGFFCEGCGEKVDKWALQCPKCGKIFDSIKCPECNHTGTAVEFTNGCPKCGFMSKEQKIQFKNRNKGSIEVKESFGSDVPSSIFIMAIVALLGITGILVFIIFKLIS